MNRREFIAGVGGAALVPASARAQQKRTRPLVAYFYPGLASNRASAADLLLQALQEVGYKPGRDYDLVERYTEGQAERIPGIIADIAKLQADVTVVFAASATIEVARQITTVPIIAVSFGVDPVQAGVIQSWSHPGGNVSGISNLPPGLPGKWLQLLIYLKPEIGRIAVLSNPDNSAAEALAAEAVMAGQLLGIDMRLTDLRYSDDVTQVFAKIAADGCEAVEAIADFSFNDRADAIAAAAFKYRLPAIYTAANFVSAGGLVIYEASLRDQYRRAASMIKKVLDGQNIATIPFELASKFDLTINLKTAKGMGLTVPDTLLALADTVIE